MAYGVRWQIPFVALDGNKFRIDIFVQNYAGDPVTLRGAVSPIETNEDSNDDIFAPIRKQTGKLMIADTGRDEDGNEFDYREILPGNILGTNSRQVQLWQIGESETDDDILRWIGYIRPDTLTSRLFEKVSIREFQLVCPLGAMYEAPVSFSNTATDRGTVRTMGQILYKALDSLSVEWDTVYMQRNITDRKDITSKVSLINFLSENKPTHSETSDNEAFTATWTEEGTSWGSIVEEICKFWGWTLYTRGFNIYIVARHQFAQFIRFDFDYLLDTSEYNFDPEYDSGSFVDVTTDIEDLRFASTNHSESRQLGYRNISVNSSVHEQPTVLDPDYSKLEMSYWTVGGMQSQPIHVSNNYMYILRRMGVYNSTDKVQRQFIDNYQIWENRQLQIQTLDVPFITYFSDSWQGEEYPTKSSFNMKKGICSYKGGQSTMNRTFFAKTLEDICIPQGSTLCIEAKAELNYNPDPDYPFGGESNNKTGPFTGENTTPPYADPEWHSDSGKWIRRPVFEKTEENNGQQTLTQRSISVSLKCGDKYWDDDNQTWTTTEKKFHLTTSADGTITRPRNTYTNNAVHGILFDCPYGTNGFCLLNQTANINGRLKLTLYAEPGEPTSRLMNCVLTDLTISIYNPDDKMYPKAKGTHEYKDVASTSFNRNLSVNLAMASANDSTYGTGLVYTNQIVPLTTVPVLNNIGQAEDKIPEQNLLDTMKSAYSYATTSDTIEVFDDITAECPICRVSGHWSEDEVFQPLHVSHKWRDGTMRLTLIDK